MPRQYFRCPNCGTLDLLTYRVEDTEDPARWPPVCTTPECFDVRMDRAPQPGDFSIDAKEPGQRSVVYRQVPTREGLVQVREEIDSDHKRAQIEKDSEQRYRDGEGEPLRFRSRHQNASNMDQNSFGTSGQIGERTYDSGSTPQKSGKVKVTKHGAKKPDVKIARGGGVSALK